MVIYQKKINPDGSIENISHSYTANTITKTLISGHNQINKVVQYQDHANQPYKIETYDANNILTTTQRYQNDPFGRLISQTSPLGATISYSYDGYDRVINEISTTGVIKETIFDSHSTKELPLIKKVNGEIIARNQYDGMERIVQESIGNYTKTYSYAGSAVNQLPSAITTSPQHMTNRIYCPYHKQITSECSSKSGIQNNKSKKSYKYHPIHHQLIESQNHIGRNLYTYTDNGFLNTAKFSYQSSLTGDKPDVCEITNTYSTMGMLTLRQVAMTNNFYNGYFEKRGYDEIGRLSTFYFMIQDDKILVTIHYDNLSRPVRFEIVGPRFHKNPVNLIKEIDYDDFSRPTAVHFLTFDNRPIINATMTYNEADQITQLSVTLEQDPDVHYTENYRYDSAGRLIEYEPSTRVLDEYKNHIIKENIHFDEKNNITYKNTQLADGMNSKIYNYSSSNSLELSSITNTHSKYPDNINFSYDQQGNVISDQDNIAYSYTDDNKMERITNTATGKLYTSYEYDAEGRQACTAKYNDSGQLMQLNKKFYTDDQLAFDYLAINNVDELKWTGYHRIFDELLFTSQKKKATH